MQTPVLNIDVVLGGKRHVITRNDVFAVVTIDIQVPTLVGREAAIDLFPKASSAQYYGYYILWLIRNSGELLHYQVLPALRCVSKEFAWCGLVLRTCLLC